MKPKILLGTITSSHKDYCWPEFCDLLKRIKASYGENLSIMIVDNTKPSKGGEEHAKSLQKDIPEAKVIYHPSHDSVPIRISMLDSMAYIRDEILKNKDIEYWFSLETDVFIPENLIEHLITHRKHVVGLKYFLFQSFASRPIGHQIEDFGDNVMTQVGFPDDNFVKFDGQLQETYQIGFGCLLVHRSIIEKIPFRCELDGVVEGHPDIYFHDDLRNLGFKCYCDTSLIGLHINSNWKKIKNK